jgi:hypothetical protein
MSRIDDALRRLKGGTPEPRLPSFLDRFASEGKPSRIDDAVKPMRADDHKVAAFVPPPSHSSDARPHAVPKIVMAPPPPPPPQEPKAPEPRVEPELSAEVDKLLDFRQVTDYLGFIPRSILRHKKLAALTFALAVVLSVTVALLIPKTYYVQVKLLAQRNAVMTALSNPGRAVPWDADAPTRAAAETVLRRDNLISLITQTNLMQEWDRTRAPIVKFKDWARSVILRRKPTPDEKLGMLVWMLENRLIVTAGPIGDGTVTFDLYWPDAEMAYRLVEAARQSFLEARQVAETTAISESIAILERYSTTVQQDVNRAVGELQAAQPRKGAVGPVRRPAAAASVVTAAATVAPASGALPTLDVDPAMLPDPELNRLKQDVLAKRQELAKLEDARQHQVADLQAKLSTLLTVYTETHPSVVSVRQNLNALKNEPPQMATLRTQLEDLEAKYQDRAAAADDQLIQAELKRREAAAALAPTQVAAAAPVVRETAPVAEAPPVERPRTDETEFAGVRLRTELNQLQSLLERTDGARIELAVSQAAFKYRYSVIRPAQVPKDPLSPNLRLILLAGFIASLLLAVAVVVGVDLMSNRILEPWQVERQLGVPILGTVRLA